MADVKQSNPNWIRDMERKIDELDRYQAKVGWFDNSVYPDGTPVAYVATIQEFGYGKIPPRLGMRETFNAKQTKWKGDAERAIKRFLNGKISARDVWDVIGQKGEDDVAKHITSVLSPPLTTLTLAIRKKREQGKKITGTLIGELAEKLDEGKKVALSSNTKPLDDTGYLISTLTHNVEST